MLDSDKTYRQTPSVLRAGLFLLTSLVLFVFVAGEAYADRFFQRNSTWYEKIPANPIFDPNSTHYIQDLIQNNSDVLTPSWGEWSVPVYRASGSTAGVTVNVWGPMKSVVEARGWHLNVPIPVGAEPGGGPNKTAACDGPYHDANMTVISADGRYVWDMQAVGHCDGVYHAYRLRKWDLTTDGMNYPNDGLGNVRSTASPLLQGLITYDEVVNKGVIDHAICMATWRETGCSHTANYPSGQSRNVAEWCNSQEESDRLPLMKMGERIQLDPSVDCSQVTYDNFGRIVCKALQEYGMVFCENSGPGYNTLYIENRSKGSNAFGDWSGIIQGDSLESIPMNKFRVVRAPCDPNYYGSSACDGLFSTADTEAPSVPANVTATAVASSTQINLSWSPSTDNVGVAGYKLYKNGSLIATVSKTTYSDAGLMASILYSYTVSAYDGAGNVSGQSAAVAATPQAVSDTQAPSVPANVDAITVSSSQINLTWSASTDNVGVSGYKVYRDGILIATISGTSYSDKALPPSGTFEYTVAAYDGAGNVSGHSAPIVDNTLAAPDTKVPSVPAGLTATAVSYSQINLSWSASSDNVGVSGYRVYRNGTQIAAVATTSYSNTGLSASTTYSYTVTAYDAAGNVSGQSAAVSATTPAALDTKVPSVPAGLTATAVSYSQINLSWSASSDNVGIRGYRVYRNGTQIAAVATTSYSNTGLTASTTYSYTVTAYDAAGNVSGQSAAVSAATPAALDTQAPSMPANVTATAVSPTQINLSWNASTDNVGVAGYKLYRNGSLIAVTTKTSYSNTGLLASTSYTYRVLAYDARGNISAQSAVVSATTLKVVVSLDIQAPSMPANVTATAVSPTQINLSWNASTDNVGVAGYRLYRNGSLIAVTTKTSYSNTGLLASTSYTYRVLAYDARGNISAQSAVVSATTLKVVVSLDIQAPSMPANVTATAVSPTQINLSWSPSTDNVGVAGYRLYRNGSLIAVTTKTSYSNTGLLASTSYTYRVLAYDARGNISAQSAVVSATTLKVVVSLDIQTPSVPANVDAITVSSSQINLTWSASTDNVGVAGYKLYRNGSLIAVTTKTSYSVTGLPASTTFRYNVAAYDAAGNASGQSAPVWDNTL